MSKSNENENYHNSHHPSKVSDPKMDDQGLHRNRPKRNKIQEVSFLDVGQTYILDGCALRKKY